MRCAAGRGVAPTNLRYFHVDMSQSNAAELLQRALGLPAEDRLALATELLNNVEEPEDDEWSDAWARELDRRSAAVERGEETLEDWPSVEARIRAELSEK